MATVSLNLPVSSAPTPNFADPGEQGSFDGMAISVLDPNASLPLLEDQSHAIIGNGNGWLNKAYFPAPAQTDMEYVTPTDPSGYEMLASFTLSAGGGATTPAPTRTPQMPMPPVPMAPAPPDQGLNLRAAGAVTTPNIVAPLTLGQACKSAHRGDDPDAHRARDRRRYRVAQTQAARARGHRHRHDDRPDR